MRVTSVECYRMNFEHLPQRAAELASASSEHYDAVLARLFRECLLHYDKITGYVEYVLALCVLTYEWAMLCN